MTKVLVIGPGALGAAIGASLCLRGHQVAFQGRSGPQALKFDLDHGRQLGFTQVGLQHYDFAVPNSDFLVEVQLIVVAVKAYDLATALQACRGLAVDAPIVALGNGSVEAIIRQEAAQQAKRIWRLGTTTIGISQLPTEPKSRSYCVRSTTGKIAFGPFLGDPSWRTPIETSLTDNDLLWHWEPAALYAHRRKWLFNTVINSLCAVHRLRRNGDLLMRPKELEEVFFEALRLGEDLWGSWQEPKAILHESLLSLIHATCENENSMARDVRLGIATESAFLAGLAGSDGRFPCLQALHQAITKC